MQNYAYGVVTKSCEIFGYDMEVCINLRQIHNMRTINLYAIDNHTCTFSFI